ncbi:MAG: hypothetical protein ACFFEN_05190 [Candidatus Thorarchaeota archaeon]
MKKAKIISLTCISLLLAFSFVNVANAQVPSYVGVNTGDTYIYAATADMNAVNTTMEGLIGAANWSLVYSMLDEMVYNMTSYQYHIGDLLGLGLKLDVTNMTEEQPTWGAGTPGVGLYLNISVAYEPNEWTLMLNQTWPEFPMIWLFDPAYIGQQTWHYYLSYGYFFHPKGLNYNQLATWMALNFTMMPPMSPPNMTISSLGNGLRFTFLGSFLEDMIAAPFPIAGGISDVVIDAKWNSNGVFYYASLAYGGLTLATIQLVAGGANEIPGFVISLVLGTMATAMICAIYIIKKKKRIL